MKEWVRAKPYTVGSRGAILAVTREGGRGATMNPEAITGKEGNDWGSMALSEKVDLLKKTRQNN